MFGLILKLAAAVASAIGLSLNTTARAACRYQGPPVPLRRRAANHFALDVSSHANGGKRPRVKGKRDKSLRARSNRRKAAR